MNKVAAAKEMLKLAKSLTASGYMGWYEAGSGYSTAWAMSNTALDRVTDVDMVDLFKEATAVVVDGITRASRIAGSPIKFTLQESFLQTGGGDRIRGVALARLDFLTAEQTVGMVKVFGKQGYRP